MRATTAKCKSIDWQKQAWNTNALPVQGNCQLYNLGEKLYAANNNSIQQITEDGRGTKLLASIQRQPPITSLDSQGALRNLVLFTDARNSLCAAVHNKVFRWDGTNWQEVGAALTSFPPLVFEDGVVFLTDNWNLSPAQIFRLDRGSNRIELCLRQQDQDRMGSSATASNEGAKPVWNLPVELSLPNLSASLWHSDLCLMVDHSKKEVIVNEQQQQIVAEKFLPKDEYDSALYYFSRGQAAARKLLLKFENSEGCPPMAGLGSNSQPLIPEMGTTKAWMLFTPKFLLCGRERFGNTPGSSEPAGARPGIWVIPLDPIMSQIAALKQPLFSQQQK